MAAQLPKAKRVGGMDRRLVQILIGVVAVLIVAIGFILLNGNLFNDQPKTPAERDYELLLDGLRRHPDDVAVLMTLAEAEYKLGKRGDAMEHAAKAATLATSTAGIPMRYGQLLLQENKPADAKKWVQKEIDLDKGKANMEPRFLMAQIVFNQGKKYHKEGLQMMAAALNIAYQSADMRITYAGMLAADGQKQAAIKEYKDALRYLPNDKRAVDGLAKLGVTTQPTSNTQSPHSSGAPTSSGK